MPPTRCASGHSVNASDSYIFNPGSEPLDYRTLGEVLEESTRKNPTRPAVRSIFEDSTMTYEELLHQGDALGCAMRNLGLEKRDRFGVWCHNNTASITALVAAARVGLIVVLINPLYEKLELSFCLKKTGVKALIIGEEIPSRNYYEIMTNLIPELHNSKPGSLMSQEFPMLTNLILFGTNNLPGTLPLSSLLMMNWSSCDVMEFGRESTCDDGVIIHFTSGSTGDPKAVLGSHHSVVNMAYFNGKRCSLQESQHKVFLQVPIFHILSSVVTVIGALLHGSTLVLGAPIYNAACNFNALLKEQCTAVTGTPTMYIDLLKEFTTRSSKDQGECKLSLKVASVAGATCSSQLFQDIRNVLGVEMVQSIYGQTETGGGVFQSLPTDHMDVVADTVGYIQEHVEIKVVDQKGEVVPFGSPGELMYRGYGTMVCYWDEPDKTRQTVDEDGWLHTGDEFILTAGGYGKIMGRFKDIIVRGGENISPSEIEECLNTHPNIIDSQVIGVFHERLGEEICAVVRTNDGAALTLEAIKSYCTGRIARFKIPRVLKVVKDYPKTATHKIQKSRLREKYENGTL